MTAISRGRVRRAVRTTVAVGAVSLGLAALSGCTKPSPNAHFTLGSATQTLQTDDDCYAQDGQLDQEAARGCIESIEDTPYYDVEYGDTLRVGVDADVSENGWLLLVNGTIESIEPSSTTYRSFNTDELFALAQSQDMPGADPEADPFGQVVQVTVAEVSEDFDVEALLTGFQEAQMGAPESFDEALYGRMQGVWNLQLEPA